MKTLNEWGLIHGTDQASSGHDYLTRLEPFFFPRMYQTKAVVEIGIAGGASLKVWRDYFPGATIYGLDHNIEFVKAANFDPARIQPLLHEASDEQEWLRFANNWPAPIDIVIDDASHTVAATVNAFNFGWSLLAPGGLWVIQDTHAGYRAEYRRDNKNRCLGEDQTVMDYFAQRGKSAIDEDGERQCGKATVASIDFLHWSKSLLIIGKR